MYRCCVCKAKVGAGEPLRKHIFFRQNGSVQRECPVCSDCSGKISAAPKELRDTEFFKLYEHYQRSIPAPTPVADPAPVEPAKAPEPTFTELYGGSGTASIAQRVIQKVRGKSLLGAKPHVPAPKKKGKRQ